MQPVLDRLPLPGAQGQAEKTKQIVEKDTNGCGVVAAKLKCLAFAPNAEIDGYRDRSSLDVDRDIEVCVRARIDIGQLALSARPPSVAPTYTVGLFRARFAAVCIYYNIDGWSRQDV